MEIPIQNIYFLLCYAWDKLEERDLVDVDPVGITELVNLFSRVLISGTNHLLKRGFDRNYVLHEEQTGRLKGKIRFDAIIKAGVPTATLPCEFDELSYDVVHNRILKATARRLMRTDTVSKENAEGLAALCRQLPEVKDIELTGQIFGQVVLHRNNQFYDFLMKLCALIHHNLLVSEIRGRSRFRDFTRDKHQMEVLFENFVRNFYRQHTRSQYSVGREYIRWKLIARDPSDDKLLPRMETDISLEAEGRKIIIECKYTPEATQTHFESEKLRSEHLYQLHAYLSNLPDQKSRCEGMLLYPEVDKPLAGVFTGNGRTISIRTINLHQPWLAIHDDLLGLVA